MTNSRDTERREMRAVELLPCPFCGGEPERFFRSHQSMPSWREESVRCTTLGCKATGTIEFWNKRASQPAPGGAGGTREEIAILQRVRRSLDRMSDGSAVEIRELDKVIALLASPAPPHEGDGQDSDLAVIATLAYNEGTQAHGCLNGIANMKRAIAAMTEHAVAEVDSALSDALKRRDRHSSHHHGQAE